jgi:hypothetical protein
VDKPDDHLGATVVRGGRWLTVAAALAVSIALFARAFPYGYSSSPDVAHHYALIRWLLEHWGISDAAAPILGEMAVYPRYAHALAAIVGTIAHSPFLGMQVVATAALIASWTAIASFARIAPARASWFFTVTLLCLLAINRVTLNLDLFGHEIVVNYFFSQLVGQACFLILVAGCARYEYKHGFSIVPPLIAIVFAVASAGLHLLPAIEGVGYGLLIMASYAASDRRFWKRRALLLVAATALAAIAIYHHPAFGAMRTISDNNGYLPLSSLSTLPRLMVLAGLVGLASFALICWSLPWHRYALPQGAAAARHIGCAGGAIALLCILQAIAAKLGIGSDYACRKYAFGLSSFLFIDTAYLVAMILLRNERLVAANRSSALAWLQPSLLIAAMWIFTFSRSHREVDAPSFLAMEGAATTAWQTGATVGSQHAYARGLVLGGMSNVANYLVSQAIFGSPRDGNGYAPLYDRDFPNPESVGAILSSTAHPSVWSDAACVKTRLGDGFVISDGPCILSKFSDVCRDTFDFSSAGFLPGSMMSGFSSAEAAGRWTDGDIASVTCKYATDARPAHELLIDVEPFSPNGHIQVLDIAVNGVHAGNYRLSAPMTLAVQVPDGAWQDPNALTVSLSLPQAISPKDAGISSDGRKLGLMVRRLILK